MQMVQVTFDISIERMRKMSSYETYGPVNPVKLEATENLPERKCYDFYEGKDRRSIGSREQFLMDALVNKEQMSSWIQLAYQIFESEPDSCWNHSKKSWADNFGEKANYMDLIDCLCNKYDKTKGTDGDPHKSTGLVLAGSLDEVEQAAGGLIEDLIGRKLKADEFINRCNLEPFHDNKDSQLVYYTIAGHCDRYGKTYQFGYNAFGLAFYNFRLKVVTDGTPYNTAIGNRTIEEAIKEGGIPGFTCMNSGTIQNSFAKTINNSRNEITQGLSMSSEIREAESNSITDSEQYSFSEMVGLSLEIEDILKVNKVTATMQFTAEQVIGTAYSKESSVEKSHSMTSDITVPVPPHTAVMVKQKENNVVTTLKYDCPVMVQFDVAVFSMCGTCYDDNAAVQAFGTAGYDQRSFITIFQPSDAGAAGEDGSENLYMRCNSSVDGYEKMHGFTQLKTNKKGLLKQCLDWKVILAQPKASTNCKSEGEKIGTKVPKELVNWIAQNRPMSPTGGILTETGKGFEMEYEKVLPTQPLEILVMTTGYDCYDMGTGDILYPSCWTIAGYDIEEVPFYGFRSKLGKWILTDEQGEELKDDSIAGIYMEALTNKVYIKGNAEGTVYAKYLIRDDYYTYYIEGASQEVTITNENISEPVYVKLIIHDTRLEGKIETSGSIEVKNNTITNLEQFNGENVHVYDETGKEITVPLIWEVESGYGNGIMIVDNQMSASAVGTYRIRARYEELISDSIDVYVTE